MIAAGEHPGPAVGVQSVLLAHERRARGGWWAIGIVPGRFQHCAGLDLIVALPYAGDMIIQRRLALRTVLIFAAYTAGRGLIWATCVFALYVWADLSWLRVPFLPIATVGTAVAFYVGFKNNASYERFWEGRKIWGGIVNSSRTWGTAVMAYIAPTDKSEEAQALRKLLIYRQLAWINALRLQLRKNSRFFNKPAKGTKKRLEEHAEGMRNDWDKELTPFLDEEEFRTLSARANTATHLLTAQGETLAELVGQKRLDLFHQIALMEVVEELYGLQGKCERIKNTPFPRFYAEYSRIFTRVFTLLIPFGMLDVFADHVAAAGGAVEEVLAMLPMVFASALVTWVFATMEGIGDATEDPFERSMNDVPMNALCRTIEIDLREMLGETDLPEKEKPLGPFLY